MNGETQEIEIWGPERVTNDGMHRNATVEETQEDYEKHLLREEKERHVLQIYPDVEVEKLTDDQLGGWACMADIALRRLTVNEMSGEEQLQIATEMVNNWKRARGELQENVSG